MNRETAPRFAGIGGHHSAKPGTVEWLTPPWLLKLLTDTMGRAYRMDPCACIAIFWVRRYKAMSFSVRPNPVFRFSHPK